MVVRNYLEKNTTSKKVTFLFEKTGYKKSYKNALDVLSKKKCDYLFAIIEKIDENENELIISYKWPEHYQTWQ